MTPAELASLVRAKTKTNSTTFTDTDIKLYLNSRKDDIAKEIIKINEDLFGIAKTADLVADQRDYTMPEAVLNQIKMLEVQLDGENWQRIKETDLNFYDRPTTNTDVKAAYTGKLPEFGIFGRSIYIFSGDDIIDVTDGLKLWCFIYPEDITDLTSDVDMSSPTNGSSTALPGEFHFLLQMLVIIDYKNSRNKPIPLTQREQSVEVDLEKAIGAILWGNLDRSVLGTTPYNDGSQY